MTQEILIYLPCAIHKPANTLKINEFTSEHKQMAFLRKTRANAGPGTKMFTEFILSFHQHFIMKEDA